MVTKVQKATHFKRIDSFLPLDCFFFWVLGFGHRSDRKRKGIEYDKCYDLFEHFSLLDSFVIWLKKMDWIEIWFSDTDTFRAPSEECDSWNFFNGNVFNGNLHFNIILN